MAVITLVIIIVVIVATFAVQNAAPVAIAFLFWRFQASLAIVVFLSVLAGIITASIAAFLIRMKRSGKKTPNL